MAGCMGCSLVLYRTGVPSKKLLGIQEQNGYKAMLWRGGRQHAPLGGRFTANEASVIRQRLDQLGT